MRTFSLARLALFATAVSAFSPPVVPRCLPRNLNHFSKGPRCLTNHQTSMVRPPAIKMHMAMESSGQEAVPMILFLVAVAASVAIGAGAKELDSTLSTAVESDSSSVAIIDTEEKKEIELKDEQQTVSLAEEETEGEGEQESVLEEELQEKHETQTVEVEETAPVAAVGVTAAALAEQLSRLRREVSSTLEEEMEKEARAREAARKREEANRQKVVQKDAAVTTRVDKSPAPASGSSVKESRIIPKVLRVFKKIIAPWRKWENIS